MRLQLKAEPGELATKGEALVRAVARALAGEAPELSDALHKAIPTAAPKPAYPVLKELQADFTAAYQAQMRAMLQDIGKVLDSAVTDVKKSGSIDDFHKRVQALYDEGYSTDDVKKLLTDLESFGKSEPVNLLTKSRSHHYVRRERHGDHWVYFYTDGSTLRSNADNVHYSVPSDQHIAIDHVPLNADELRVVRWYQQGNSFQELQGTLRAGAHPFGPEETGKLQKLAGVLDDAISKHTLQSDGVVFRGVRGGEWSDNLTVGSTLEDPAFVSTSNNINVAISFAHMQPGNPVVFHIHLQKGQNALPMNTHLPNSGYDQEEELLLGTNRSFIVVGKTVEGGVTHLDLELQHD